MPLVKRLLSDMLSMSSHVDVMVNPVNTHGVAGAGLAKAFAEFYPPEMVTGYKAACLGPTGTPGEGVLQVGRLHIWHDPKSKNIVVNLPTKRDWRDGSNLNDVAIGCARLAEFLKTIPYHTVAMPILGTGYGLLPIYEVMPTLNEHLDYLPNIIHLCMRPDRLPQPPKYLVIAGSRAFKDFEKIEAGVLEGLAKFNLDHKDFEAAVSGGAAGVDTVGVGLNHPKKGHPNVATMYGYRTIVAFADWKRFGDSAGFIRNRTVADIGTHFVVFIGRKSTGSRMLVELVEKYNEKTQTEIAELQAKPVDMFDKPIFLPVEKQLHICDISAISD